MATITISLPKEFEEIKRKFPEINWNEVLKAAIIKKLKEIEKFQRMIEKGGL